MDLHHLSYSGLKSWKTCGEQYRLLKGLGLPDVPGWYHAGGTALHEMTAARDWATVGGDPVTKSFNDFFDQAISDQEEQSGTLRTDWKVAGPKKAPEDESWWRHQGQGMANKWTNWLNNAPLDIWITPTGEPAIELEVEPTFGDVLSKGFIDRVLITRDDQLVVVDLKTGKPPEDHQQLATYAEAISQKGWHCEHGGYYMARGGILTGVHDLRQEMGARLAYDYSQVATAIEHDIFPPVISGLCKNHCPVNKFCFAWGGERAEEYRPF